MLTRASTLDHRAFDAVASARLPGLEYVLPRLSRAADHSVLWTGIAAAMWATRRPSLRRAALRGAVAVGVASPAVNLVGKQAFRRRRPLLDLVPPIRTRRRLPTSPSFPSGHSASAAAFATGVAMEASPAFALPVAGVAAAVAFSRIYTGAHYPGDVAAGLAVGSLAGLATRLLWPTRPSAARVARYLPSPVVPETASGWARRHAPGDQGAGVVIVVNSKAGGGGSVVSTLRDNLPEAEIVEVSGELEKVLEDAATRAQVLAVCGGDGTVSAGAQVALAHDLPLLVIPGGTLNHFSRALGMETVLDSVNAYRSGSLARVDVACVGEEVALNTASFGAYTELVTRREQLQDRLGKWPALAVAAVGVLRDSEPVDVYVDGGRRRVWFAFVGNCEYASRGVAPTWRDRLDDGVLDIRMIGAKHQFSKSRAVAALLVGHLRVVPEYDAWKATSLRLSGVDGPLRVTRDGEIGMAGSEIVITKRPGALAVFRS
jgi:diacylglycerol kinase family enzyme/membrane-associated phospholipid phosphatase